MGGAQERWEELRKDGRSSGKMGGAQERWEEPAVASDIKG